MRGQIILHFVPVLSGLSNSSTAKGMGINCSVGELHGNGGWILQDLRSEEWTSDSSTAEGMGNLTTAKVGYLGDVVELGLADGGDAGGVLSVGLEVARPLQEPVGGADYGTRAELESPGGVTQI